MENWEVMHSQCMCLCLYPDHFNYLTNKLPVPFIELTADVSDGFFRKNVWVGTSNWPE